MASSSSGIFKAILVIIFVGVVFYGLNWLLEPAPEDTQSAESAVADTEVEVIEGSQATMSPEEAEAARYGAEIGRRVGSEIGRQVGLAAVAGLQAAGVEPGSVEMATEDEEVDEVEEVAPVMAAKPEPKPAPVVVAKPDEKPEPKPETKPEPVVVAKPEPAPTPEPTPEPVTAKPEPAVASSTSAEPQEDATDTMAVSYTHLTLPTIYSV